MRLFFCFLIASALWVVVAVYGALSGWWMNAIAEPGDGDAFAAEVIERISRENLGNTAFVLLHEGAVVAEHYAQKDRGVHRDTVFPTASFSKWITALSVMKLVEEGAVDLDAPIEQYLTRWQLPVGEFDSSAVTVRRVLSHTAGLTDGLGFGDYTADEVLPSIEESLRNPRASNNRDVSIAIGQQPGESFLYSGGGFLILQLMIEEVSKVSYEKFVSDLFLQPLGMQRSTFDFIGTMENTSQSFTRDGELAPSFRYASAGATGFASTARDLTALVQGLTSVNPTFPLLDSTIGSMREPEAYLFGFPLWGLGTILYAPTSNGDYVYGHDGVNDPAINVAVRINPQTRDGYIMLVNGHPSLASNLGSEWVLWQTGSPDVLSTERALRTALWPSIAGVILLLFTAFLWWFRRRS